MLVESFKNLFAPAKLYAALLNAKMEVVAAVDNIGFLDNPVPEGSSILTDQIWGNSDNLKEIEHLISHITGDYQPEPVIISKENIGHSSRYQITVQRAWDNEHLLIQVKEKEGHQLANSIMQNREELFLSILEHSSVGIVITDKNGQPFYINQVAADFFETSKNNAAELSFKGVTHPEDISKEENLYNDFLEGKIDGYELEKRFVTKSGKVKWGRLHVSTLNEGGKSRYFLGTILDITDIKNTYQQLEEKNELYFALVDQAPIGIVVHQGGKVKLANKETLRMIDCPRFEDLQDRSIQEFIHPADKKAVQSRIRQMLEKEKTVRLTEERLVTLKGKVLTAVGNAIKVRYNGKPAVQAIFNDITEQKEMEQKLWEEKEKSEQYLNVASAIIVVLNASGKIERINDKGKQVLGYPEKELIGRNWFDFIPPKNERERYRKRFLGIVEKGKRPDYNEGSIITKDGQSRIIGWHSSVFRMDESSNPHLVISGQDITDQKRIEAERLELIEKQKKYNKDLQEFAYVVSHNLRSPVSSILGLVEVAKSATGRKEKLVESLDKLKKTAQELNYVIDDLNEILVARQSGLNPSTPVLLEEVLEPVLNLMAKDIEEYNVKINIDFGEPEVFAVRSYLNNIFYNLINNAIKYRKPDVSPEIKIRTRRENRKVMLTVADNGIGFNMKTSGDKVFQLYQRFHSHKEGKGMGLYLVKSQVESMGGEIDFESEEGKGTTFYITFPADN